MGLLKRILARHGHAAGRLLIALTQSSTDAPTGVVIENSLVDANGDPVTLALAYTSTGIYTITASAAVFTAGRTAVVAGNRGLVTAQTNVAVTSTTVLTVTTTNDGTAANALLTNHVVGVEVYPVAG